MFFATTVIDPTSSISFKTDNFKSCENLLVINTPKLIVYTILSEKLVSALYTWLEGKTTKKFFSNQIIVRDELSCFNSVLNSNSITRVNLFRRRVVATTNVRPNDDIIFMKVFIWRKCCKFFEFVFDF